MDRESVVDKLVADEIDTIKTMIQNDDLSYIDSIVRYGGIAGFHNLCNEDLEKEYFEKFDEVIKIS